MYRTLLIGTTIALTCSLMPIAYAEDTSGTTGTSVPAQESGTPSQMPKDSWLNSMNPMLPDLICKGFVQDTDLKKRFDEIKMTYEQCVTLIPDSAKKCQTELYAQIPDQINNEIASTWGRKLGECIGRDFAEKYLIPKKS